MKVKTIAGGFLVPRGIHSISQDGTILDQNNSEEFAFCETMIRQCQSMLDGKPADWGCRSRWETKLEYWKDKQLALETGREVEL